MTREKLLNTSDEDMWRQYLPENRSVFGSLGYARIWSAIREVHPRLYVIESDDAWICYPFFLRPLAQLPFRTDVAGEWDSATPDFTGPMMFGEDDQLASEFSNSRNALFQSERVVAEFAHLHPWSGPGAFTEGCTHNRDIVWVDTGLSPETLWRDHFEHCCRKNIKRALQEDVRIVVGRTEADVQEFHRIYLSTMERRDALPQYLFPYEFFAAFLRELPDNSRFVLAEVRGQVVAATLYLYDDANVYSFLGGADAAFQHMRPTNAVIWDTIRWSHETSKKRLILGGGYSAEDGIFRFKATFSPLRQPFFTYRRIHRDQDYLALERGCREYNGLNGQPISYFPSYRYSAGREKS